MKAIRLHQYGGLDCVLLEEIPVPQIALNEVLIRVEIASVNPLDVKLISGNMQAHFPLTLPYALGIDLAGTVAAVGALVPHWKAGDRVIARLEPAPGVGRGFSRGGAFSEYAAVPVHHIARAPVGSLFDTSAGLPTAAGTAWQALFEAGGLRSGQKVLIHAGAGGVGSFAVQMAKNAGANVVATASPKNHDLVRSLGADQVIDYHVENFAKSLRDVDLVLDTIGGETQNNSYNVLRPAGTLLTVVTPPDQEKAKEHNVTAAWVGNTTNGARLGLLSNLCEEKAVRVVVDRIFPLVETKAALAYSAAGHAKGKILITTV
jgi:NADPH:quinone reductase-like Zn-dependent oxidoreductase